MIYILDATEEGRIAALTSRWADLATYNGAEEPLLFAAEAPFTFSPLTNAVYEEAAEQFLFADAHHKHSCWGDFLARYKVEHPGNATCHEANDLLQTCSTCADACRASLVCMLSHGTSDAAYQGCLTAYRHGDRDDQPFSVARAFDLSPGLMPLWYALLAMGLCAFGTLIFRVSSTLPVRRGMLQDSEEPGTPYQRY